MHHPEDYHDATDYYDYYDNYDPHDRLEPYTPIIRAAKAAIKEFFRWRRTPFHFRQLQVLFETQFFHITTAQAVYELIDDGFLHTTPYQAGANEVTFVVPARATESPHTRRILRSHMIAKAKAISLYDSPEVSRDLGRHFEALVRAELRANQLNIVSVSAKSYKGKVWTRSMANLDIIADHPDGRAFGVQAKNELKSIEKDELLDQIDICASLGLLPLFVVRYMPWSFVPLVRSRGGFVTTIGTQIYPIGYRRLCQQVRDKLSIPEGRVSVRLRELAPKMRTRWPVEVLTELPEDHSTRLAYWLNTGKLPPPQKVTSPPS